MGNCSYFVFLLFTLLPIRYLAASPAITPAVLKQGKQVFQKNCVSCHGIKGDGNGPAAKVISPKPRNFIRDQFKYGGKVEEIFKTITTGIEGTAMPSWANISEQDRRAVAAYIEHLSKTAPIKKKKRPKIR